MARPSILPPRARILLLDIETFPALFYAWQTWEATALWIVEDTSICAWSAKWLGGRQITKTIKDYPGYKPGSRDDRKLLADLWKLIDRADMIGAHNGDRFDVKKINFRFMVHGMPPPSPFQQIDTLKAIKRVASGDSHKLDELGRAFKFGRKLATGGKDLWRDCLSGDAAAWKRMKAYNAHDVRMLEDLYLRIRPWMKSHPNLMRSEMSCPKCGSDRMRPKGWRRTATRVYQRFRCLDCKGWASGTESVGKVKITNAA